MLGPQDVQQKVTDLKRCSSCKETKPLTSFYKNKRARDGKSHACDECIKARVRKAYDVDKARAMRARNKERYYNYGFVKRLKAFGLTPDTYWEMHAAQGGVCAICRDPGWTSRRLAVDHCHETGKVRALLCGPCNVTLGQMKENPTALRAAADYLEKHNALTK